VKTAQKILLLHLHPALKSALEQQLDGFVLAGVPDGGIVDLVVCTEGKGGEERARGCPILAVPETLPLRLGALLREIARRLEAPVLYLDDIPLAAGLFRPREKLLESREGTCVELTDREVDMLAYLVRHEGRPVSREDLLRNVWRYQDGVDTHTLETHIHRLRRKTGAEDIIVTEEGGYRLCAKDGKGQT
jgi:hypothetical protein